MLGVTHRYSGLLQAINAPLDPAAPL